MSLEIVQSWLLLLSDKKFEEAANLVADDMKLSTPKHGNFNGKDEWEKNIPIIEKDPPSWESPTMDENGKQVTIKGHKKFGFITVKVMRTIELNDEGKIKSDVGKKI